MSPITFDTGGVTWDGAAADPPPVNGSIAPTIFAALAPLFNSKVYPLVAPDQSVPPFAVYAVVSMVPNTTLADGAPLDNARYQIDVYATSYLEAQQLADAARAALLAIPYPIAVTLALRMDEFEFDVKLHRVIQDFSFWTPRSIP